MPRWKTLGRRAALASSVCILAIASAKSEESSFAQIERGRYLAVAGDCVSCHTAPGGKPFSGGFGVETPFGTIYSSNITPDPDTGIGRWTDEQFYKALHDGVSANGDPL